jgi:hypothetical protein
MEQEGSSILIFQPGGCDALAETARRIQTGMRSDLLILASEEEFLGPFAAASGFGKATWAQRDLCVLTAIPIATFLRSRISSAMFLMQHG